VPEGDIALREYLLVLIRKWWIVAGVVVVTVAAVWLFGRLLPPAPAVYEARTKLLIVAPLSEKLIGPGANPLAGASLSVETLSALATANDSLQRIIAELDLRDSVTGRPWALEQLAAMMKPKTALPLLTMTVRGRDPALLKRIADKWAEVFVQKNSQLFSTEAARSYEFILAQYNETQAALRKLEEDHTRYLAEVPLALLKDELDLQRSNLKQYQDALLNLSAQLALKMQEYQETVTRLNELTIDGHWIGLQQSSDGNPGAPAGTPAQAAVLQAKQQLFGIQDRIRDFQKVSDLALLKQRLSLKRELLGGYLTQLEAAENTVKTQSRTLEAQEAEIKGQPQFLVLVKAVTDSALWEKLGVNPSADDWKRVRELGLRTEEANPTFFMLTERIINTRTSIETERERTNLLARRVEETRREVKSLEGELSDKEDVQLPRLKNELAVAQAAYDKEQAVYIDVKDQAVDLRNAIRKTQAQRDEHEKLVDAYRANVSALSKRTVFAALQVTTFDRQHSELESPLKVLSPRLQEARIAKEEQAGSIRVVEAAVEPQVPVLGDPRRSLRFLAPVLGLFLGVALVFLVRYLQVPSAPQQERHPPQPGPPEP
jgi:capsular polysaccharide biosynthesis protein